MLLLLLSCELVMVASSSSTPQQVFSLFGEVGLEPVVTTREPTPNLLELAAQLNLTTCIENLRLAKVDRVLNHEGWFTLFCPTNQAFAREKFYPGEDTMVDKMRMHVARGKFSSDLFENEMTFKSLLSKRTIRINQYTVKEKTMTTANGRAVGEVDYVARNGFLHIIDDVMSSVYDRAGTVISEIDECCPQHSQLLELVKTAGMFDTLDQVDPVTFLAPVNAAWDQIHPDFVDQLKKDIKLLRQVLSAHVITGTWYTAGLSDGDKLKSWSGDTVLVVKDSSGIFSFNGAQTTLVDVTAGNGAVHSVDAVIMPKTARMRFKRILRKLNKPTLKN